MRAVDADELKEQFNWSEVCLLSINEIKQIIDDAPTVRPENDLSVAIKTIKDVCKDNNICTTCPMNRNCNEQPAKWEVKE